MFPLSKNGHEYGFHDDAFWHRTPAGREQKFPYSSPLHLKISFFTGALSLRGPEGSAPLRPLSATEQKALLIEFFERWKNRNADAAKKAAYDYIDGQKQFLPVALVACLFIGLPVGIALTNDAREQYVCTKELQAHQALGTMNVTKFSKKRKGHYVLTLNFTAPNGQVIEGTDQLIMGVDREMQEDEMERSIPKTVPVVYSPNRPECWSLTPNATSNEPNWAKRRYFTAVGSLFGSFFLFVSLWGLTWSALGLRFRKRPYAKEIAGIFHFN